jgi:hypothetical protein
MSQWSDPNYRAYQNHLRRARRNMGFHLTFDEWMTIWTESGHFHERGLGGYVMARNNDSGPYAIGNVKIITQRENNLEWFRRKTPEEVEQWKAGLNGHTPQARIKRGVSIRKARAEKHWSCSPKDPSAREQWIENLRQSQVEHHQNSPRPRTAKGRFSKKDET